MCNQKLGRYIRIERKKRRMTLQQLSKISKVSVSQLSRMERGVGGSPSIEQLHNIAHALYIPMYTMLVKAGLIEVDTTKIALYKRIDSFLQCEDIQRIHQLSLEYLNEEDRHSLYDMVIHTLHLISYKYRQ